MEFFELHTSKVPVVMECGTCHGYDEEGDELRNCL